MENMIKNPIKLSEITLSKKEESREIALSFKHDFDQDVAGFILNVEYVKEDENGNELFESKQEKKIVFIRKDEEYPLVVELSKTAVGGRVYLTNIILENGGHILKSQEIRFQDPEWAERQKEKAAKAKEIEENEVESEVVEEETVHERDKSLFGLMLANVIIGFIASIWALLMLFKGFYLQFINSLIPGTPAFDYLGGLSIENPNIYCAVFVIAGFVLTLLTSIKNLKHCKKTGIFSIVLAVTFLINGLNYTPILSYLGFAGLSIAHFFMDLGIKVDKNKVAFGVTLFVTGLIYYILSFCAIGMVRIGSDDYLYCSYICEFVYPLLAGEIIVVSLLGIKSGKKLPVASLIILLVYIYGTFSLIPVLKGGNNATPMAVNFFLGLIYQLIFTTSLILSFISIGMKKVANIVMISALGLAMLTPYAIDVVMGISGGMGRKNSPAEPGDYGNSEPSVPASDIADLEIHTYNTKTQFNVGDTFTCQGLVVIAWLKNGSKITLDPSSYVVDAPDMSTAGQKDVKVRYGQLYSVYTIYVV